ncbi:MAG: rod shape-determining protein RodA [bacterium]|nr:rod shape-determining protein RodA [bacterium]MDT8396383.1 rod shape-determining protein RodA [bacterium]
MRGLWNPMRVDAILVGCAVALSGIGIMVIRSATRGGPFQHYGGRQAYWLAIGLAAFFLGYFADRRHLQRGAYVLYGMMFAVLVGLAVAGKWSGGVQRWVHAGGLTFQPSEMAKIILILALARYFNRQKAQPPYGLEGIAIPLLMVAGYAVPVAAQPDLGTAMFLVLISAAMILFVGVRWSTILTLSLVAAAAVPSLFFALKEYQRNRILNFLSPERDPLGTGYHVVQSKIAIGSGGLLGKGFQQGTQSQLRFIPEQHTDFIISVLAEEFGFLGVLLVLGLVLFLSLYLLSFVEFTRTRFSLLVVVGITFAFAMQAAINVAMAAGLLPVVGLPMPLLSYGGSSLVVTWLGFGIIAGYKRRR